MYGKSPPASTSRSTKTKTMRHEELPALRGNAVGGGRPLIDQPARRSLIKRSVRNVLSRMPGTSLRRLQTILLPITNHICSANGTWIYIKSALLKELSLCNLETQ